MPKTKADYDQEIEYLRKRIENQKVVIANVKKAKADAIAHHGERINIDAVLGDAKTEIDYCQRKIKRLQEMKKSLK